MRTPIIATLLCCFALCGSAAPSPSTPSPLTPVEHRRTPDQTFLTFPEWFLVHSPAEYAEFLQTSERPSEFPLFTHIGQFWQSYAAVNQAIRQYPFNGGYHLMVMVIGSSTSVEYTLKGLYEHSIGQLAEATKSQAQVPEERFAARYAQAYVDFIRVEPWYKFDFWQQLKALWSEAPFTGPDLIRRWERRFALTSELLTKEGYARLIKLGTQTLYDAPKPITVAVLSKAPAPNASALPELQILQANLPGGGVLASLPRYEGFTSHARALAAQGVDFIEVAGNRGDILVSMLVPQTWQPRQGRVLFEQPILTHPGRKRSVMTLPVAAMSQALREAAAVDAGVVVEHIYDY